MITEGLSDDVLRFIDVDEVVAMWADLVLSPHVRAPWARWLHAHGLLDRSGLGEAARWLPSAGWPPPRPAVRRPARR